MQALYDNWWSPTHESLNIGGEYSFAFTPYLRGTALVGKVFGLTAYGALQLAGVLNALLVLSGMVALAHAREPTAEGRLRFRDPWIVALALLVFCLLLRDRNALWSSELSLRTWAVVWGYPSTHAWGLVLWLFALARPALLGVRWWRGGAIAALMWALMLAHPLTASWGFGIVGVFCLYGLWLASDRRRAFLRAVIVVAAMLAGVAIAAFWPNAAFMNPAITGAVAADPAKGDPWAFVQTPLLMAIPASVFLAVRGMSLASLFAAIATALVLFGAQVVELSYGTRYVYFLLFALHVVLAEACAASVGLAFHRASHVGQRFGGGIALLGFAFAVWRAPMLSERASDTKGTLHRPSALWKAPPAAERFYGQLGNISKLLKTGDVVLTNDLRIGLVLAPITGAKSVYGRFAVHVPDAQERQRASREVFLASTSKKKRARMVAQWGATHLLASGKSPRVIAKLSAQYGPALSAHGKLVLFSAKPLSSAEDSGQPDLDEQQEEPEFSDEDPTPSGTADGEDE